MIQTQRMIIAGPLAVNTSLVIAVAHGLPFFDSNKTWGTHFLRPTIVHKNLAVQSGLIPCAF